MRGILDSIGTRLDEARDVARYLTGLLVFLGLLGTFWGLLETVGSIGHGDPVARGRRPTPAAIFEDLKAGLAAPLGGMGIAFSSSLFGLAGSLVLGFLDLQAGQAQNRFYTDLEDWLSTTVRDLGVGRAEGAGVRPPARWSMISARRDAPRAGDANRAPAAPRSRSTSSPSAIGSRLEHAVKPVMAVAGNSRSRQ